MNCPNCKANDGFDLVETADDYQDGYVECRSCGKQIATFEFSVIVNV